MQADIEKHLFEISSLLPPWAGFVRLCHKCHVFGIFAMPSTLFSRIAWTFLHHSDKLAATRIPHLVGGKQNFFFLHTFLVIKAKMKFLKISLLFLQHHLSWTSWSYYPARILSLPSLTAASSPWATSLSLQQLSRSSQAQGSLISQNNSTAGRNTSSVAWRCAVLNITRP